MGLEFGAAGFNTPGMNDMVSNFLFGSDSSMDPYNAKSLSMLLKMLQSGGGLQSDPSYQGGSDFLRRLFSNDPQMMQDFNAPYIDQFNQQTVPDIANRFAGMGTGASGLSSSGFQQTLAQAGRGLQKDLASMRQGMQLQGLPQALQYAQQPINNRFNAATAIPQQYYHTPGQPGFLQSFAGGAAQGAGKAATNWLLPGGGI